MLYNWQCPHRLGGPLIGATARGIRGGPNLQMVILGAIIAVFLIRLKTPVTERCHWDTPPLSLLFQLWR